MFSRCCVATVGLFERINYCDKRPIQASDINLCLIFMKVRRWKSDLEK